MSDSKICVLGAGSSGIAAAKVLKDHGLAFDCFEKGSGIGGNWRFRNDNGMSASYRSLHINTSKTRMAYSDFPMPEGYPDYPHHSQILEYFEHYVDHFGIRDDIHFRHMVEEVRCAEGGDGEGGGGWEVEVLDEASGERQRRRYRAVLVANGHHWNPRWPDFPGDFDGRILHAHEYETPEGFEDKRVLVVGIGNSGVDISCETSRVAEKVFLSTRRSAHVLPKYAFGVPIDHLASPFSSRLPLWMQGLAYKAILGIARGQQERFGVPEPGHGILQAHPTISADLLNLVGHGELTIKPNLERLDGDMVHFVDGSSERIDILVYATGYKISLPFFKDDYLKTTENRVRLYRHVAHPELDGLFFIGLIQPLGAIMPLAEAQAQWTAKLLTGECELPARDVMERRIDSDLDAMQKRYVTSPRHTIQVDFYPYLRTLQGEMARRARRAA